MIDAKGLFTLAFILDPAEFTLALGTVARLLGLVWLLLCLFLLIHGVVVLLFPPVPALNFWDA